MQCGAATIASIAHVPIDSLHVFMNLIAYRTLEDSGNVRALVLELVETLTLADHIATGTVTVDEALAIAGQIASVSKLLKSG